MTLTRLAFQSLRFYWRTQLGVLLGATLAAAILIGALAVGDSVRFTLEKQALARVGDAHFVLAAQDRFFREQLARELADDLRTSVAPMLIARGTVNTPDDKHRANGVQIIGVDERFFSLSPGKNDPLKNAPEESLAINERLADRLGIKVGGLLIVRMEEPSQISRDAPLSGETDVSLVLRANVAAIATDAQFGRFSLQANQVPPLTVFVPLKNLQRQLKQRDHANALLVGATTLKNADAALRKRFQLADAGLELRKISSGLELRTERVFLEAPVVDAAKKTVEELAAFVLTYFVNELRHGERTTPYSMVTALGPPWMELGGPGHRLGVGNGYSFYPIPNDPNPLDDDEIVINSWLADDLAAKEGDQITLKFFVLGNSRKLEEKSHAFKVRAVVPMEGAAADPSWMPPFPGITDAESCRDWKPGIPFDNTRIRPKDEDYWKKFRGTPKAFVSLATGQKLWGNRFGNLTAIRWQIAREEAPALERELIEKIDPAKLGFVFQPVREQALAASRQSMDFGQLFIGFSFFLIIAALLLTAMLFVFNLEQRSEQTGLLLALGWSPRQIKRALLLEGLGLSICGALAGIGGGIFYTKLTLRALATVWREAVGGAAFAFHIAPASLASGAIASVLAAMLAIGFVVRGQTRRPAARLLASGAEAGQSPPAHGWRASIGLWVGIASIFGAMVMIVFAPRGKGEETAETFFSAGSMLLVGGIALSHWLFVGMSKTHVVASSLARMGMRGVSRRRGRSLATLGVLASGVFMVVAVSAFRQSPPGGAPQRQSGTGGFTLFAQSTLPIYEDLNDAKAREAFGIDEKIFGDTRVVAMRAREGDDASCLNLNRALQPRVLGVRAEQLQARRAFVFQSAIDKTKVADAWRMLDDSTSDGAVPAIADEQTVTWALGKKLGDTIEFADDRGAAFRAKIVAVMAGSILQGSVVISERNFIAHFPSSAGHRVFLIDTPPARAKVIAQELSRALGDKGFEAVSASQRLAEFQAVENSYLAIFQALGGLGLLLGSAGLAIVVLRNVLERRGEFALMQAIGFQKWELRRLLVSEHWLLIALGLAIGMISAVASVLPVFAAPHEARSSSFVWLIILALGLGGAVWTWLAARVALRGPLLNALRNE